MSDKAKIFVVMSEVTLRMMRRPTTLLMGTTYYLMNEVTLSQLLFITHTATLAALGG